MDFGELLRKAWGDVKAAELPETLQGLALTEGLKFYAGESDTVRRTGPRPAPAGASGGSPAFEGDPEDTDVGAVIARIEHGTGVETSILEDLMTLVDGKIHLHLPRRVFKGTVISNARTVMTFVAGARRYGLDERSTTADYMRDVLIQVDLYDNKNFKTKHIAEVPGTSWVKPQSVLQAKGDLHQKFAEAAQALHEALGK